MGAGGPGVGGPAGTGAARRPGVGRSGAGRPAGGRAGAVREGARCRLVPARALAAEGSVLMGRSFPSGADCGACCRSLQSACRRRSRRCGASSPAHGRARRGAPDERSRGAGTAAVAPRARRSAHDDPISAGAPGEKHRVRRTDIPMCSHGTSWCVFLERLRACPAFVSGRADRAFWIGRSGSFGRSDREGSMGLAGGDSEVIAGGLLGVGVGVGGLLGPQGAVTVLVAGLSGSGSVAGGESLLVAGCWLLAARCRSLFAAVRQSVRPVAGRRSPTIVPPHSMVIHNFHRSARDPGVERGEGIESRHKRNDSSMASMCVVAEPFSCVSWGWWREYRSVSGRRWGR